MQTRSLRLMIAAAALGGCLSATTALAQMDPEGGDVWVPPPDDTQQQQQPPPQQQPWYGQQQQQQQQPPPPPRQDPPPPPAAAPSAGRDDHQRVVNRLAVGYQGATLIPIGDLAAGGVGSVTAPTIGIRYWFGELVGIDVGVGLGFIGGNVESGSNSAPVDNAFGMLIHAGVPLAIYHAQHYKFLIIPEVNLGFSTGTHYDASNPDGDRGRSGFLFQLGGRLGTEIHFGFMNIPQLSLQASVGLYFNYSQAGIGGNRTGAVDRVGVNAYSLGTTVMGEPWDILLGSLTALYYF